MPFSLFCAVFALLFLAEALYLCAIPTPRQSHRYYMKTPNRICIYPKDIVRITGKSERYGRKLLEKIKKQLSKGEDQFVTVEEFCQFTGLKAEQVQPFMAG